jgi:hypothetical protein
MIGSALARKVDRYARRPRIALGFARAAATAPLRALDPADIDSWEFRAFSAGGEDGIIDHLTRHLVDPDWSFIEIGAADGLANITAWLALARGFRGVMVDADRRLTRRARIVADANPLVRILTLAVDERTVERVVVSADSRAPDVLSLDVDGDDFAIARALLELGVRPKVFVLEYNSAFGPDRACTVAPMPAGGRPPLYYGASIAGWRGLLEARGYRFLGVERMGVNAFFADPAHFAGGFLDAVHARPFRENVAQGRLHGGGWEEQLRSIAHLELVDLPGPARAVPAGS